MVVVLLLTVGLAFAVQWGYGRIVRRIVRRTATTLDDTLFDFLHPAIRSSVLLLGAGVCLPLLGLSAAFERILLAVAKSLAILVWSTAAIRVLSATVRHLGTAGRFQVFQPRTVPLFDTVQKVFVTAGAIYLVFVTWRIDVTGWVASAGIVGIAVGFAARDTLANLFSGIFIMVDSPYRVGDMILLDSGERGRVTEVGIRSTRILTREDVEIIIPNSAIGAGKVTNESGGPHRKRRVDVRVGVSYASDIRRVREVLLEVGRELDVVCDDPEPRIRFREMGDSALVFSLLFWIRDPEDRGRAVDEVNTRIFERFAEEGIEIPFPQRVVHWAGPAPPER